MGTVLIESRRHRNFDELITINAIRTASDEQKKLFFAMNACARRLDFVCSFSIFPRKIDDITGAKI